MVSVIIETVKAFPKLHLSLSHRTHWSNPLPLPIALSQVVATFSWNLTQPLLVTLLLLSPACCRLKHLYCTASVFLLNRFDGKFLFFLAKTESVAIDCVGVFTLLVVSEIVLPDFVVVDCVVFGTSVVVLVMSEVGESVVTNCVGVWTSVVVSEVPFVWWFLVLYLELLWRFV